MNRRITMSRRIVMRLFVITFALLEPIAHGLVAARTHQVDTSMDLLGLMYRGVTPATLPLVVMLLAPVDFADQVAHRYLAYCRPRCDLRRHIQKRVVHAALSVGAIYLVGTALAAATALAASRWPLTGHVLIDGPSGTAATFTQLTDYSTALYVFVYSVWVALNAALITVATMVLVLLLKSRLLALVLPFLVYWVENFVLAVLGLEQYRTVSAIFPFSLRQQPIWTALVMPLVWSCVVLLLAGSTRRRTDSLAALA